MIGYDITLESWTENGSSNQWNGLYNRTDIEYIDTCYTYPQCANQPNESCGVIT